MYDSHTHRMRHPGGLLLVPMIDIFTVLVTFLLMTAVFARIAILQIDLPSSADGKVAEPAFRLEVIVRKSGLELTNGTAVIATLPTVNGAYDLKALSELALSLKRENPDVDNASILLEEEVEYDSLIQVMDAIRSTELPAATTEANLSDAQNRGDPQTTKVPLFTKIAVGDAP